MTYLAATNRQVPDQSIMDLAGRQAYLGNQYSATKTITVGTQEIPLLLLYNSQTGSPQNFKSLFQNVLKVIENTASRSVILNVYLNPTFATNGIQTIAFAADSGGSLNSTFFLLNDAQGNGYYVWFNINSAGVDPAVVGRTGVEVAGATNAAAATLGAAAKALIIALNTGLSFSATGTATLTITNIATGPFTPAVDGSAPTSFVFAVTAGEGALVTPVNIRSSYGNNSIAIISSTPTVSANGTLVDTITAIAQASATSNLLKILDQGQSLLVTGIASGASASITTILQWFEI